MPSTKLTEFKQSTFIKGGSQNKNPAASGICYYICDFLEKHKDVASKSNAAINTESPAWGIDRLSILALKVYHMNEEATRTDAMESHRNACQIKLNVLLEQRVDLSTAIEQLIVSFEAGNKYMKVYKQMKMYNDDELNPVLRARK